MVADREASSRSESGEPAIRELVRACEDYVSHALGVHLDRTPETLPLLDHYLVAARGGVEERPELLHVIVRAVGAYFGEIVRGRIDGFWRMPSSDLLGWTVCARPVFLWVNPFGVVYEVLEQRPDHAGPSSELRVAPEDADVVWRRLAQLPAVSEGEYYLLSTRVEAIETAADALGRQMALDGHADVSFDPDDYDRT